MASIILHQYDKDKELCIVDMLKTYLEKTAKLRSDGKLFICTQAPHRGVARAIISRWIKTVLKNAGIDTDKFKAHSTCAAVASAAHSKGLQLSTILKAIGWSQESMFRQFYNKQETNLVNFRIVRCKARIELWLVYRR